MKELEEQLEKLQNELAILEESWAREIKEISSKPRFNVYSKRAEKLIYAIADKYADRMSENIDQQRVISDKMAVLEEQARKKQYKD